MDRWVHDEWWMSTWESGAWLVSRNLSFNTCLLFSTDPIVGQLKAWSWILIMIMMKSQNHIQTIVIFRWYCIVHQIILYCVYAYTHTYNGSLPLTLCPKYDFKWQMHCVIFMRRVLLPGFNPNILTNRSNVSFREGKLWVAKVLWPNLDAPSSSSFCWLLNWSRIPIWVTDTGTLSW